MEYFIKNDGPTVTYGDNGKGATNRFGSIKYKSIVFKNVSYVKGLWIISFTSARCVMLTMKFSLTREKEWLLIKRVLLFLLQIEKMTLIFWICFLLTTLYSHLNWLWHKRLSHLNINNISMILVVLITSKGEENQVFLQAKVLVFCYQTFSTSSHGSISTSSG
uniref:GAG-pre-integrase domain-containing protein n=1 Tax=Lactuca sativa TaxID=4236 RepID=A0A9R1V6Y6_LACSA|nr:hypothetical protein LSAT_V11C600312640 [Lactuca sativa]